MLRRADVVEGAIKLLDEQGLDGLTIRKLAASLSVQGPAMYRHFPSKEALLDAIADRLLDGVAAPVPEAPWHEQLTSLMKRLREALLAHRDGARVVAGTFVTGPNTRMVGDAIFEVLAPTGLSPVRAGWAIFALGHFTLGHTIEEQAQLHLSASEGWSTRLAEISTEAESEFARAALAATFQAQPAERFTYGLQLMIASLRAEVEAGRG